MPSAASLDVRVGTTVRPAIRWRRTRCVAGPLSFPPQCSPSTRDDDPSGPRERNEALHTNPTAVTTANSPARLPSPQINGSPTLVPDAATTSGACPMARLNDVGIRQSSRRSSLPCCRSRPMPEPNPSHRGPGGDWMRAECHAADWPRSPPEINGEAVFFWTPGLAPRSSRRGLPGPSAHPDPKGRTRKGPQQS
jgi:hypothetical protein